MKKILFHIIFYTSIFQYANCYAAVDSLPSCICDMKKTYPRLSAREYDYKGQSWFLIVQDTLTDKVIKNSDHQTHLKFYNKDCQLVCTWTKGGIAVLNRVIPDSIEKEKIIKLPAKPDTAVKKNNIPQTGISSDTLFKMGISKKINWIEETNCLGETFFRFEKKSVVQNDSQIIFEDIYYNKEGKALPKGNNCITKYWWHLSNGKYIRTQFRPGYR